VRDDRYGTVFRLATRLLRGETIERVDEHGRYWRATATALYWFEPATGELAPVVEGDAYEVAERFGSLR
jgi:hypothetical protein